MRASPDRLVLVGIMGSGKSTVGRLVADRLGWKHIDLDDQIERQAGMTVAELFDRKGETRFREMEAEAGKDALRHARVVLTPGGGWPMNSRVEFPPGNGALTVWLETAPAEVVRRLQTSDEIEARPLLRGGDPGTRIIKLLDERAPVYARSDLRIDTTGRTPHDIATELLRIIRRTD